jgi:hypothetical protein
MALEKQLGTLVKTTIFMLRQESIGLRDNLLTIVSIGPQIDSCEWRTIAKQASKGFN